MPVTCQAGARSTQGTTNRAEQEVATLDEPTPTRSEPNKKPTQKGDRERERGERRVKKSHLGEGYHKRGLTNTNAAPCGNRSRGAYSRAQPLLSYSRAQLLHTPAIQQGTATPHTCHTAGHSYSTHLPYSRAGLPHTLVIQQGTATPHTCQLCRPISAETGSGCASVLNTHFVRGRIGGWSCSTSFSTSFRTSPSVGAHSQYFTISYGRIIKGELKVSTPHHGKRACKRHTMGPNGYGLLRQEDTKQRGRKGRGVPGLQTGGRNI